MTRYELLQEMVSYAANSNSSHVSSMKTTVEDSGWHREASVWVHTEMVVAEFLKLWDESEYGPNDWVMFRAGIAALFHDFGKPAAETPMVNPDGVHYRRYAGHEAVSAAEFRGLATNSAAWLELFGNELQLEASDIYVIAYMIQHHLPYSYKHPLQLGVLRTTWMFNEHSLDAFFMLLRADARGRISDDHATKLTNVDNWIKDAITNFVEPELHMPSERQLAYVFVGPSGAGKSSHIAKLGDDVAIYNKDAMRLELYGDDTITDPIQHYTAAWHAANEDEKVFKVAETKRINEVARGGSRIAVSDNTNTSKKSRREFLAAVKQRKRLTVAVVFVSVSLDELIHRGKVRGNRGVPVATLTNMFYSMHLPGLDEVDVLHVV